MKLQATYLILLLALMHSSQHALAARNPGNNDTDLLGLLEFKKQISDDPYGVMRSWNDSRHHCQWPGITCDDDRHQRVTTLDLRGLSLSGSISPHIGNLSFLRFIYLAHNKLTGEIPQEIGRLSRLNHINLTSNMVGGIVPVNLSRCLELKHINLGDNRLVGNIPVELGSLLKLETLRLYQNNLTGEIPRSVGNLTSLKVLSIKYNNLQGGVPSEIGRLKLRLIGLAVNNLSGIVPPSLYNMSSIVEFSVAFNSLRGELPRNLGIPLFNLQKFGIAGNEITGTIPDSISNASWLDLLDLSTNFLRGLVPKNLGYLQNLQLLNLGGNRLGSSSAGDLDFIASLSNCSGLQRLGLDHNIFGGEIPNTIGNLSDQLAQLYLGGNNISGLIPAGFENLANLYALALEQNLISGTLPDYLGKFKNLQILNVARNRLHGIVPLSLCNLTSLYNLDLSLNRFDGIIPENIRLCQHLSSLDLSHNNLVGIIPPQLFSITSLSIFLNLSANSLMGSLPQEVGKLQNLNVLDVSENKLSGKLPQSIGDCSSLESLIMKSNLFEGLIPLRLASLRGIQYLDLSCNNLTGEIPKDLEKLQFLKYVNFSFNGLEGEVPKNGVFSNPGSISLTGNVKLCGGISELGLPPCRLEGGTREKSRMLKILIPTISIGVIFVSLSVVFAIYCRKQKRTSSTSTPSTAENFPRILYRQLLQATGGFSSENLIGSGGFGSVYKGSLAIDGSGERLVAVKVFDLLQDGASKSFEAECRALRNIRHRNLVPIITYCSSIDYKGNEFKALVYEYMENGNLDMWLHGSSFELMHSRSLSILERLNISIDVATALVYLHNDYDVPIIHCDLKPSNILLDKNLTAHISDFGLARLISKASFNSSNQQVSSIGVKGTIGYAPPEYAMGGEISTQGDVYSYGVLLLELFTGKRPTDTMFINDFDLHKYVELAVAQDVMKLADQSLLVEYEEADQVGAGKLICISDTTELQKVLVSIFKVGLDCSQRSPKDRARMYDVTNELVSIRNTFFNIGVRF